MLDNFEWAVLTYIGSGFTYVALSHPHILAGMRRVSMGWWELRLSMQCEQSLPFKPELVPCEWRCPHWRPTVMGSIGTVCVKLT
jgi:hypothetical protein